MAGKFHWKLLMLCPVEVLVNWVASPWHTVVALKLAAGCGLTVTVWVIWSEHPPAASTESVT